MEENTPLLTETFYRAEDGWLVDAEGRRGQRNQLYGIGSSVVPHQPVSHRSDPQIREDVHLEHSNEDDGKSRPKNSVGYRTDNEGESIGSGGDEDESLLNKDANKNKEDGKSKVINMILLNVILVIWSIATHIHSPVYSQYLYRRIMDEAFGNSSPPSGASHKQLNTTVCYKPSPNTSDDDGAYALQEKAQQLASEMNMQFSLCSHAFSFISTVLFGAYSDYFGRKMLFLIPLFGHLADYLMASFIIYWEMDIKFFFVTGTITGICSSEIFTIACCTYVADNTSPKGSRTIGLAVIIVTQALTNAALSTGVGYYIQLEGFFLPSLTAAAILVFAIVAVICILPGKKKDKKAHLNPLKAIRNVFAFYFFEGSCKTRWMFLVYLAAYFTHEIAMKMGNINTLWEMNYPFCWSPEMIGYYGTGSAIFTEVIKLPLLRILQCCLNDELIAIWSNICYTGSIILKSFSYNNLMMYGVAFMAAFDVSVPTVLKSVTSQMAGSDRQGALFASFAIVNIICSILGTPAYSELYKYTVNLFRGTSYLVSAGVQCLCTVFLIVFAVMEKKGYKPGTEVVLFQDNQSTEISGPRQPDEDTNV